MKTKIYQSRLQLESNTRMDKLISGLYWAVKSLQDSNPRRVHPPASSRGINEALADIEVAFQGQLNNGLDWLDGQAEMGAHDHWRVIE